MGVRNGFRDPAFNALMQRNCDPGYLGRVMGIFNSAMALGMPAGTIVGGALAGLTGVQPFIAIDGGAMLLVGALALLSRNLKCLDDVRGQ